MPTENCIIYLIGYPGTGKLTIARELCARAPNIRLVDNHLVNNVVFSLLPRSSGKLPKQVWEKISDIWGVVADVLTTLAQPQDSFVFTNVLLNDDPGDWNWFRRVEGIASARQATFLPVILRCEAKELEQRLISAERAERLKLTDVKHLQDHYQTRPILKPDHPNALELDITHQSPQQAVTSILAHLAEISA